MHLCILCLQKLFSNSADCHLMVKTLFHELNWFQKICMRFPDLMVASPCTSARPLQNICWFAYCPLVRTPITQMHMLKLIALSILFLIDAPTPSIGPLSCWYMLICLLAFGKNSHNLDAHVKINSIINLIFDWCPNSIHRTFAVLIHADLLIGLW